jgi:hypothetical protein
MHNKMASASTNLIAAVERITHACSLVVENEDNDAHLSTVLRDVEFNKRDIVMEFLQMETDKRRRFLDHVYNMHDDSSLADDKLRSVLSKEQTFIFTEEANMELKKTKLQAKKAKLRIIISNIALQLESNTTTDDDKVKLQAQAIQATAKYEEYEVVHRLHENARRAHAERLATNPWLNEDAVMHICTKLCDMVKTFESLMTMFEYDLFQAEPSMDFARQ